MKHILLAFFVLLIGVTGSASEGGWNSGGGELIGDSHNPWFLQNTSSVHYCIEIDEIGMGYGRPFVAPLIAKAFNYWKRQFALSPEGEFRIHLGTQTFILDPSCSNRSDIRFQFGILSPAQAKRIPDSTRYAGLTLRTAYDRQALRGQGIVYISPQTGKLAMTGLNMPALPWTATDGLAIYPVLLHELGHIFGLSHDSGNNLMGEQFAESILTSPMKPFIQPLFYDSEPDYIQFNQTIPFLNRLCVRSFSDGNSVSPNLFSRYFAIKVTSGSCSYAYINQALQLVVVQSPKPGIELVLGQAQLRRLPESIKRRTVARVFLPVGQAVFLSPRTTRSVVAATAEYDAVLTGQYVSNDRNVLRDVGIHVAPWEAPTISGAYEGRLIMDLDSEDSLISSSR